MVTPGEDSQGDHPSRNPCSHHLPGSQAAARVLAHLSLPRSPPRHSNEPKEQLARDTVLTWGLTAPIPRSIP